MAMNKYLMEYDLATNFDTKLFDKIKQIDENKVIKSIFGKMKNDILGGGRSSVTLPKVSFKNLDNYVKLCHENNIQFNYLLNAACLGNMDMNPVMHNEIVKFINKLCEINVDAITVSTPFLCELVKKQFPNIYVTIGVAADVTTPKQIQHWIDLGADEVTLPHKANRNFELLEAILTYTKNKNIFTRLIANNVCLHECPFKYSHSVSQSHSSQTNNSCSNLYIDYHLLSCNNQKMKNPTKILSSEWIRPEDIHYYEELCEKVGNKNLRIKLLDRTKTTDFLENVIDAYINRKFDGNLLDILVWPTKTNTKNFDYISLGKSAFKEKYNIAKLKKYIEVFDLPDIYINNNKLNGFIKFFLKNQDCTKEICRHECQGVSLNHDNTCDYCEKWAHEAITYDKEEVDKWIKKSDAFLETLKDSQFFKR